MTPLADFLELCRSAVGPHGVLIGEEALRKCGANVEGIPNQLAGVVCPTTTEQVIAVVQAAAGTGIPIYPVSGGRNWGYGTALPATLEAVVLDLSGMKRITHFDARLGVVTLEPGVTQRDLYQYLEAEGQGWLVPTSGAGPNASIVGNAVERGYGLAPTADHFAAVTRIEAVLPSGDLYRSSLDELGAVDAARCFKWGLGPYLDGLFSQGAFGVVTQMTIALAPRPSRLEAFAFQLADQSQLPRAVDAVRAVLNAVPGQIGGINLMNARRVLAMFEPESQSSKIRADDQVLAAARRFGFGAWSGFGTLYGEPCLVAAARREIRRRLSPAVGKVQFISLDRARQVRSVLGFLPGLHMLRRKLDGLIAALENANGIPSNIALPLCYRRSGTIPAPGQDFDPAGDGCGLLWYSPLVPMSGELVESYVQLVERTCVEHAVDPLITLTSVSSRCFDSTVPLLFTRDDPKAVRQAHACYEALFDRGAAKGFVPYRLGVSSMHKGVLADRVCWQMVDRVKAALDPLAIIAPGRYAASTGTGSRSVQV